MAGSITDVNTYAVPTQLTPQDSIGQRQRHGAEVQQSPRTVNRIDSGGRLRNQLTYFL